MAAAPRLYERGSCAPRLRFETTVSGLRPETEIGHPLVEIGARDPQSLRRQRYLASAGGKRAPQRSTLELRQRVGVAAHFRHNAAGARLRRRDDAGEILSRE